MVSPLAEGAVFAGRYRIHRCIAEGGMGAVYEVLHLETDRRRALKVMLPQILHSKELRERFKREARVAAQVDSEFIVDVFDAGLDEASTMPFLVMELLKGEELGARLSRLGRFGAHDAVTYLHQTALALDKTHRANIVHRDLKPENLFLTHREDGSPRIKVLDFGIAKLVAEGNTQANATQSLGTPLYMAPEQFNTGTKVSPSTDIYALGMISYTFLVGRHYWFEETRDEGNVFAFAVTAMQGPKESASARARRFNVTLPPAYDEWFRRVTHVDPKQRFTIASAAIVELGEVLGVATAAAVRASMPDVATQPIALVGSGPTVTGATITNPTVLSPKRSSAALVGGAVAATLLLAGAGVYFAFGRGPSGAPEAPAAGVESAAPAPTDTAVAAASPPTAVPAETAAPAPIDSAVAAPSASAETGAVPAKVGAAAKPAAPRPGPLPTPKPTATAAAKPGAPKPPDGIYGRD
jgi:serine/threonine-protein kinase